MKPTMEERESEDDRKEEAIAQGHQQWAVPKRCGLRKDRVSCVSSAHADLLQRHVIDRPAVACILDDPAD